MNKAGSRGASPVGRGDTTRRADESELTAHRARLEAIEQRPPPFEKLIGDLAGAYSRRINIQHRIVYQVMGQEQVVKFLRLWTHCE